MAVFELAEDAADRRRKATEEKISQGGSWVEKIQNELDAYMQEMQEFHTMEPQEVFLQLSAWSARATELRIQLGRSEGRMARKILVSEIDPFLDELERQFKYHSRFQATRDMEFRLSGGQT